MKISIFQSMGDIHNSIDMEFDSGVDTDVKFAIWVYKSVCTELEVQIPDTEKSDNT